jgi:hypothetical protein
MDSICLLLFSGSCACGSCLEWLEHAYKQHDGGLAEMKGDPLLRNIEKDPRYAAFLQKMKLPLD